MAVFPDPFAAIFSFFFINCSGSLRADWGKIPPTTPALHFQFTWKWSAVSQPATTISVPRKSPTGKLVHLLNCAFSDKESYGNEKMYDACCTCHEHRKCLTAKNKSRRGLVSYRLASRAKVWKSVQAQRLR